eukprot:1155367-Pelagomonas_calceolata.AAC.1
MHPVALTLLSTALAAALLLGKRKQRQPQYEFQRGAASLLPMSASTVDSPLSAKKRVSPRYILPAVFLAVLGLVSAAALGFYQRDWETATKVALAGIHLALAAATGAKVADLLLTSKSTGKHQGQLRSVNAPPPTHHLPNTLLNGVWIKVSVNRAAGHRVVAAHSSASSRHACLLKTHTCAYLAIAALHAPESESMAEACDLMQLGGLVR